MNKASESWSLDGETAGTNVRNGPLNPTIKPRAEGETVSEKIEQAERILVYGTSWVGDTVMSLPAIERLRRVFPAAHIAYVARPWTAGLFAETDLIDELLVHQRGSLLDTLRYAQQLRARRFDLAVLLPNAFGAAATTALARIARRIGYATDGRAFLLTHAVPVPAWRRERHEVFYYLHLASEVERACAVGRAVEPATPETPREGDPSDQKLPQLRVSPERRAFARDLLRARGVAIERPIVALCPGSTNSQAKRWPAECFAALADRLIDELDVEVVLIGAASEVEVAREIARRMRREPKSLVGALAIEQTVALLSVAALLISNDTGPAHIGGALRTPTLVIFGPTDPKLTRPFSPTAQIIANPPACAPCHLRRCPIDHRCMRRITVETVFHRAVQQIESHLSARKT